jgi:anti-anti-sigma regulatory factor
MLKITVVDLPNGRLLRIEGKLAGRWVAELGAAWARLLAAGDAASYTIDLADTEFIDRAGQEQLTAMCRAGAKLVASGCLTSALAEQIVRRAHDTVTTGVP